MSSAGIVLSITAVNCTDHLLREWGSGYPFLICICLGKERFEPRDGMAGPSTLGSDEEWSVYHPHVQVAGCSLQSTYIPKVMQSATLRAEMQLQSSPKIVCSRYFGQVLV